MTTLSISKVAMTTAIALLSVAISYPSMAATNYNKQGTSASRQQTLTQQAERIRIALANNNFASIANDTHPTRGVRFSMYAYIQPKSDKVFSRVQFAQYLKQSKIRFTWGTLDGTGELFVISLPTYLRTWVNAKQFNNARIDVNNFIDYGNKINNIRDVYPNADVVEYYYNGSEKYEGIDWRIMRLVFDNYKGKRYLVAIINNQATV